MTINQKGRTERIFVDLEAMYHSPEILGSELSIEELRAGHRGWLSKVWDPEIVKRENNEPLVEEVQTDEAVGAITREVPDKLVILRDPVALDENGVQKESSREGRGRRMKIKEVNETQISRSQWALSFSEMLIHHSQSEIVVTIWSENDQAKIGQGTNYDTSYSSRH